MAKLESVMREVMVRNARREARRVTTPLRREIRRLRRVVAGLRREFAGVRDAAARWERTAGPAVTAVSDEEARAARLSAGLIRKLRVRFGLSQAILARLLGVSATAVVQWERGRSTPAAGNRKALIGLRRLGRREVKRLVARVPAAPKTRPRATPRRSSRRRTARRVTRA